MAFKTALSGLNAAQTDLNVIGNNIANVSTFGFKKSRAEFVDVYAASYQGISRLQAGSGVRVAQIQQNMSQGLTTYTDNNLDLAIQGRGFFMVNDSGQTLFTRSGMFAPDNQGYVVNSRGQRLQVYPANVDGSFNTGTTADLQLSTAEGPPSSTTAVEVGLNLNAEEVLPAVGAFDPTDPLSYNYATSVTTYDSLGATHLDTMYFVRQPPLNSNTWNVYSTLSDPTVTAADVPPFSAVGYAEPNTPLAGFPYVEDMGTLVFTTGGALDTLASTAQSFAHSWSLNNGAVGPGPAPNTLNYSMDFQRSTQYANDSGVSFLTQDGYATGLLTGVDVDDSGVVFANYTNGVATPLGKIALANFQNPQGLQPAGDSTWLETYDSGENRMGEPGTGNLGLIQGGALEDSNVNLSEELVALIVAQRNFQASAQAITTENTVTQTIIQIR